MAVFLWPDSLTPQTFSWGVRKSGAQSRSPMGGTLEAIGFPGDYWVISVTLPPRAMRYGGEGEAFFGRLAGGIDRVLVPYWSRLTPLGTMRGAPTLNSPAAKGAQSLLIAATGTLKAGDMLGVGSQMFQVFQDCAATGGGLINVPLVNRVRTAIVAGTSVIWSRPTVTCIVPAMSSTRAYEQGAAAALPVDLEEA